MNQPTCLLPNRIALGVLAVCCFAAPCRGEVRFNRDIRPIFAEHCLHCHGPDETQRQADLRLDRARSGDDHVITAYEAESSELFKRLVSDDADLRMPPAETGKSLTAQQIELVRKWIEAGAHFEGHWAFAPIGEPSIPETRSPASTDIDRFIVAGLERRGMKMAPAVNRPQLIRRATFDLIGLPPTWDEVQAFVNDDAPDAFARVVDRLLDSPRYGERWGRHWLDIARYADTHGGSAIGFTRFPFSYTYRDYVIRAFNADLPYDRFVMEQLAADQMDLPGNDPALAGLGLLTVGMQYRNPHDVIDDQIDVVTRGMLGLTVACARCHDHKYDAIPTTDYYSLYATLANSHSPDRLPIIGPTPKSPAFDAYQTELANRQTVHDDMARDQAEVMRSRLRMQVGLYLRELAKGARESDLSAVFLSYRTDDLRPRVLNRWVKYLAEMPGDDPVFGPWVQLSALDPNDLEQRLPEMLEGWKRDNGDPAKFAHLHQLATVAPRWNPRVLEAIEQSSCRSLHDLARVYGELFAEVNRQWLQSLLEASTEAAADGEVIPDQDPRHATINSAIDQQLRRHLFYPGTPTAMPDEVAVTLLNRTVRDNLNGKRGAIDALDLGSPGSPPRAMVLQEDPREKTYHVFQRGNPIDRGEMVEARFLSALSPPDLEAFPPGERRLALARSIVDPSNPLARRVIVNFVWRHHFGRGLVRTPDDFGIRGDPPTHPDLLDYLANRLLEDGWSLKKLHRRIMLSDAYRQAAVEDPQSRMRDPENRLLWRFPRRRLDMEAMRDAMLAVSGELKTDPLGGKPFDFLADPIVPRRSVYGMVNRDIVSSLASTFDRADPNTCTAKRPETTVPQQTLFALNSSFIQDRAASFAKLSESAGDARARIRWMYQRAFSRPPDADEIALILRYVDSGRESPDEAASAMDPWQRLAHVLLAANEFVFVD